MCNLFCVTSVNVIWINFSLAAGIIPAHIPAPAPAPAPTPAPISLADA